MTKLSVNINKIATLRNARGGNMPDVLQVALDCENFGAQGVTVHPRPDERHIRYADVYHLASAVTTEYNIEGYPSDRFIQLVLDVKPAQVTLVPDPPDAITSNKGWDCKKNEAFLRDVITAFNKKGIRTSVFLDPTPDMVKYAQKTGADRIELYTEAYAVNFPVNAPAAVKDYVETAAHAKALSLGINAGHDLNLYNLAYLIKSIPFIDEVSIGHALVCDALYYGLENTIQMYLREIQKGLSF